MDSSTLLLIVAIVSVAIGYAGCAVVTASRTRKKPSQEDEIIKDEVPAKLPEQPTRKPIIESPAPMPAAPVNPNRVEIATLWRELPQGALRADFTGATVKTAKELTAEQRTQLVSLQEDLGNWLGIARIPAPTVAAKVAPTVEATAAAAPKPVVMDMPAQPVLMDAGHKKHEETAPSNGEDLPVERKAPLTIVGQIDEILQTQIKGTPLESRGIRLVESATHGVTVWIGLKAYQGMDAIPDAEVNAAIRSAVKEWEARK